MRSCNLWRKTSYFVSLFHIRHPLARLYLQHLQKKHCHQGVECLRALIQQKFAIVKLTPTLGSIQSKCVIPRKREAETLNSMMAQTSAWFSDTLFLPTLDSTNLAHFTCQWKRSTGKRWWFLYTCLTTREVHFEVVPSMSADTRWALKSLSPSEALYP